MEFSRPEYWSVYPAVPFSRGSSHPGIEPRSPTLQAENLNWTAGSHGNSIFDILRNHHTVFPHWPWHSTFPPTVYRALISLHPDQHLLFSVSSIIVILMDVRWYLIVVLSFHLLMAILYLFCCVFFNFYFFISWRLITLQYCSGFFHTLKWISHGFTCVPHPNPPSHLPLQKNVFSSFFALFKKIDLIYLFGCIGS